MGYSRRGGPRPNVVRISTEHLGAVQEVVSCRATKLEPMRMQSTYASISPSSAGPSKLFGTRTLHTWPSLSSCSSEDRSSGVDNTSYVRTCPF